ncbi:G-protein coupled photoreceptor [Branchiostoma belcheri]|nr:G-protein coupled photoreceptor [Branchiostoma belcheri]
MPLYNASAPAHDLPWDTPYSQDPVWNGSSSNSSEDVIEGGKEELQDFSDAGYTAIATGLALIDDLIWAEERKRAQKLALPARNLIRFTDTSSTSPEKTREARTSILANMQHTEGLH